MTDSTQPLHYPGTTVLVNKFDIRNRDQLRSVEYAAANARLRELLETPLSGQFDLHHLRAIHKHLLGDVYEWAGQTRDEAFKVREFIFTKDDALFAPHTELKPAADELFSALAKERHLQGQQQDKNRFVERLSHYYVELNKVHPFVEANGRATQLFLTEMSRNAGYRLDFGKVEKTKWSLAARESAAGRPGMIVDAFSKIVSPHRAVAFDKLPPEEAYKQFPELRDAFVVLANAKRMAEQRFKRPVDQVRFLTSYRTRISDELHSGNKIAPPTRERPPPPRSR